MPRSILAASSLTTFARGRSASRWQLLCRHQPHHSTLHIHCRHSLAPFNCFMHHEALQDTPSLARFHASRPPAWHSPLGPPSCIANLLRGTHLLSHLHESRALCMAHPTLQIPGSRSLLAAADLSPVSAPRAGPVTSASRTLVYSSPSIFAAVLRHITALQALGAGPARERARARSAAARGSHGSRGPCETSADTVGTPPVSCLLPPASSPASCLPAQNTAAIAASRSRT